MYIRAVLRNSQNDYLEIGVDRMSSVYSYLMTADPPESWREFDRHNPDPGYFQFDLISARHPDLYDMFALSTVGLTDELHKLVDLTGLVVADVGAGTGKCTFGVAQKAQCVFGIDAYASVLAFSEQHAQDSGITNITYLRGDSADLPLPDSSVDAVVCAWAVLDYSEAYRVLKPNGWIIHMTSAPGSLCGELTATLKSEFPKLITHVADRRLFEVDCPVIEFNAGKTINGVPFVDGMLFHDFTYEVEYGSVAEAMEILGRMYGPKAATYIQDNHQSTVAWRLRICYGRVAK